MYGKFLSQILITISLQLILFSSLLAQEEEDVVALVVTGNKSPIISPNQTINLIARAKATIPGTLKLRIDPEAPSFASNWDSKELECPSTCTVVDTLTLTPQEQDCGSYVFELVALLSTQDGVIKRDITIFINVAPRMRPEPPFTAGFSNEICWISCEAISEELRFFAANDKNSAVEFPGFLDPNLESTCQAIEGLNSGTRYGYFLQTTFLDNGSLTVLNSDTVYSVQDNAPPPAVNVKDFVVDQGGDISLYWQFKPDIVGSIEKYVVHRKSVDAASFASIDTIPFFPVTNILPANFFAKRLDLGQPIYLDGDETITEFPNDVAGSALLITRSADKWSEDKDFLSFDLATPSNIYIAYDRRMRGFPEWLDRDFKSIDRYLRTDENPSVLAIFKSRRVFPAGRVSLGGNFAAGADIFNAEPRMYVVLIQPVDRILPYDSGEVISFVDPLGAEHDQETFQYRIDAFDAAGNMSTGITSQPIILDLKGRCKPIIAEWFAFRNQEGQTFSQGLSNRITVLDPESEASCVGFRATDSLRFQAARGSAAIFEADQPENLGELFFDSGWLAVQNGGRQLDYVFDLLPTGRDPNFVNGQVYFYRVRAKDKHGNLSAWSDTVSAIQDVFLPSDISQLNATNRIFPEANEGCIDVSWGQASDPISGVHRYIIYRSDNDGTAFAAIDSVPANQLTYCDTLSGIGENRIVHYKISVKDGAGNRRLIDDSAWETSLRALAGPIITADSTSMILCPPGILGTSQETLTLMVDIFDEAGISGYLARIAGPNNVDTKVFPAPLSEQTVCPLADIDGIYEVRLRAFYPNGDSTIFSNAIAVKRKLILQPVSTISAKQDSAPTGDIILDWTHPDGAEIVQFKIFAWHEGDSQPDTPTTILTGQTLRWRQEFEAQSLVAYQCNNYIVRAVDCFGLESTGDPVIALYSNRPPEFNSFLIDSTSGMLHVFWERPQPRLLEDDSFDAEVAVFRDSLGPEPDTVITVFNKTQLAFIPEPMHNYYFRVREIVLDDLGQSCSDSLISAWSEPLVVPLNPPRSVAFQYQVLPVHPDSTTGSVFISWQDYHDPAVTSFDVVINSMTPQKAADADTFLVRGLDLAQAYEIEVLAVDDLGQRSRGNSKAQITFHPRWQFTPKPEPVRPGCFRDSMLVHWDWVDEDLLPPTGDSYGAQTIEIELSLDPQFRVRKTTTVLEFTRSFTFYKETHFPFVTNENRELYIRARARDRWGHSSPWSTEYPELGYVQAAFDNVSPGIVNCFIDSVCAPVLGGPGKVSVILKWDKMEDDCSGVWYYEITRNDRIIGQDSSQANLHRFLERGLNNDPQLLNQVWKVHAVDSVGNRQAIASNCTVPFVLSAPDSGWCENDTTLCWNSGSASEAGVDIAYFVEGARFPQFFGNPGTQNIIAGPLETLCLSISRPWEQVYWRVKTQADNIESAWSDTFFCILNPSQVTSVEPLAEETLPTEFALEQNFPNPFNPSTVIEFQVPNRGTSPHVSIEVYNVTGQRIRALVQEEKAPGRYRVVWDGTDDFGRPVANGIYLYRMKAGAFTATQRMVFLK